MANQQFVALKTFFSSEFKSEYVEGLTYTIRPGNDKLAELATKWAEEGKIAFGGIVTEGKVGGTGDVTGKEQP